MDPHQRTLDEYFFLALLAADGPGDRFIIGESQAGEQVSTLGIACTQETLASLFMSGAPTLPVREISYFWPSVSSSCSGRSSQAFATQDDILLFYCAIAVT